MGANRSLTYLELDMWLPLADDDDDATVQSSLASKGFAACIRAVADGNRSLVCLRIAHCRADVLRNCDAQIAADILRRPLIVLGLAQREDPPTLAIEASTASLVRSTAPLGFCLTRCGCGCDCGQVERHNWMRLAPLILFLRANAAHPFRYCILPLLRGIMAAATEWTIDHIVGHIRCERDPDDSSADDH